jgi:pimeloyl-ACP methyl ester carboxylesterase
MPTVTLSAGPVDYDDTGGDGPVLVLLHGVLMDATVWRPVVDRLAGRHRCVTPTLPLGSHRRPMHPDADLSLRGTTRLIGEFLDALDLHDVVLVGNDWGGAQLLTVHGDDSRVARLVLVACEAFDNYPPGLPGRTLALAARSRAGLWLGVRLLGTRIGRQMPGGWGWMSKRPVPDDVVDGWFAPATHDPAVRRDLRKYAARSPDRGTLLDWSARQAAFDRPVLVVWAGEDRIMPRDHGSRLARLYPAGRLVEIVDSWTLVPRDRPAALAAVIEDFLETPG